MLPSIKFLTLVLPQVLGHAVMTDPVPRKTGPLQEERCGAGYTKAIENDIAGPIEDAMKKIDADYKCNAYLCRGYQFEDNEDNVKSVTVGETINFQINLIAGHTPGYANVSVVDLETNTIIGDPIATWGEGQWPDVTLPYNDTDFNATIPEAVKEPCSSAGKCAIQWFWYAMKNKQTYESCVDIVVE